MRLFVATTIFPFICWISSACAAPVGPEELFSGCTNLATMRSPNSNQPATINFLNKTSTNINIIWIDFGGARKLYKTLLANQNLSQGTYIGHVWLVTDAAGDCLGAFRTTQSQGLIIKDAQDGAADWGIRSAYDAVGTWTYLNAPSLDCFHRFPQYDMKKSQTIYTNAVIYCTTLISIIGYDKKMHYD